MTALGHSDFLQALGWAVVNSLWQMALLWVVFNLIISVSRTISSSGKSNWAAGLLMIGFAWFVFTFISIIINKETNSSLVTVNALSNDVNQQLNTWLERTMPFASIVYILLLAIPALRFIRNYRYAQIIRKQELEKMPVEWRMFIGKVAAQIGITRTVKIWISNLVASPVTIGYLKPVILMPLAAVTNLTTHQMEAVLLHELAHIKRHDYLINLIINCIQTVLYFNPFAKAFVKTIERERERSCDELVMQFQYDPHNYASALLMLEKNSVNMYQMAMAASGKSDLLSRIERILNVEKKNVFSFNKMAGLFAGLLCVIILNAVIIVGKPIAENAGVAFEKIGSPAFFFSDEESTIPAEDAKNKEQTPPVETSVAVIENHASPGNSMTNDEEVSEEENTDDAVEIEPSFQFTTVANIADVMPELSKAEEKHVRLALDATKKVIENAQWKEIEKSIADALTDLEKEHVKAKYMEELEKLNWSKLEHKMKASYDQLNWERINEKLNTAITEIRLDSLVEVYTIADQHLNELEKEIEATASSPCAVPSPASAPVPNVPQVTLQEIKANQKVIKLNLEKVKAIRDKKIIHL